MKRQRQSPTAPFSRWHRRVGMTSALLVLWLALTGIALNHTEDLALDERYLSSNALLTWYGVTVPDEVLSFRVGEHWISQIGERLYFNEREIDGSYSALLGAVTTPDAIVVAVDGHLLLLTPTGEKMELLGAVHGVPAAMAAIGLNGQRVVVRGAHGNYVADRELGQWRASKAEPTAWAQPTTTPVDRRDRLLARYRARVLTWERVMRDLHSGRLFGRFGYLIMDVAAIGFIVLAGTGVWLWSRRNQSKSTKRSGRGRSPVVR